MDYKLWDTFKKKFYNFELTSEDPSEVSCSGFRGKGLKPHCESICKGLLVIPQWFVWNIVH